MTPQTPAGRTAKRLLALYGIDDVGVLIEVFRRGAGVPTEVRRRLGVNSETIRKWRRRFVLEASYYQIHPEIQRIVDEETPPS